MKRIKALLLVVALTFNSVLFASTNSEDLKADSAVITNEIGKLLQNPSFLIEKEIVARVTLTLNKNNEMVVLSVDSENTQIESFIKSRLNYNELPSAVSAVDKIFIVPVRFPPEE
jgi:hypothetical protein